MPRYDAPKGTAVGIPTGNGESRLIEFKGKPVDVVDPELAAVLDDLVSDRRNVIHRAREKGKE